MEFNFIKLFNISIILAIIANILQEFELKKRNVLAALGQLQEENQKIHTKFVIKLRVM